jgi:hypothetical protein
VILSTTDGRCSVDETGQYLLSHVAAMNAEVLHLLVESSKAGAEMQNLAMATFTSTKMEIREASDEVSPIPSLSPPSRISSSRHLQVGRKLEEWWKDKVASRTAR